MFTGIAGFTLGLQEIAQPAAYCEIDPNAVRMLRARMSENRIPTAPICADVQTLDRDWLQRHTGDARVDLITAGFPCQGVGAAGSRYA